MGLLTSLSATAQALITKYGMSATLTRVTEGTYDPATGKPSISEATEACKVYLAGQSDYRRDSADSSLVTGYLTGITRPKVNDRLTTIDGTDWTIISVRPAQVEGGDVLYSLSLRVA